MWGHREESRGWLEGAAPSAETVAAREPIGARDLGALLSSITGQNIGTMTGCAGLAYMGLAVGEWWRTASEAPVALAAINGLIGVALIAFSIRIRSQALPATWWLHVAGLLFVLFTGTITLGYALNRDPTTIYLFVLIQFAAGALLHSRGWLIAVMVLGDLSWVGVSMVVPGVGWLPGLAYLAGFSVVIVGMHLVRRRTLVELHELRLAAERASGSKTEFLATASHEVRTPMTGIVGLGALLLETELDEKQRRMVRAIRDSAEALIDVVDEVLDFSQLQEGKLELDPVQFDMVTLVEGVVELMEPRAATKRLSLTYDVDEMEQTGFIGDPGRLRQVLLNFINNAIKFTESGAIVVRTELLTRGTPSRVRVSVRDTGAGIPESALERIFDRYQRQSEDEEPKSTGAGLGLAISKQLVELMGGQIGVRSELGQGTTFFVELDLEPGREDTLRVEGPPGIGDLIIRQGLRVLVAEDNPTNRMVIEALLKQLCCNVDVATDGRDAVQRAKTVRYDVVLLDCSMPLMDGFQATRRIREDSLNRDVPVIGLTASMGDEDRRRCLDAGMNDTMAKPIRAPMLKTLFKRWLSVPTARRLTSTSTSPGPSALDMQMVQRLISLDEDDDGFVEEVMIAYLRQLRAALVTLTADLESGDIEAVHRVAHSIKGASRQIGATRIGELLGEIEREEAPEAARKLVEELASEIPPVEEAVQSLMLRVLGANSRRVGEAPYAAEG